MRSTVSQFRAGANKQDFAPLAGDIIFGNRLSLMQGVMNVSGDQWTHVAIVDGVDDKLATIEIGMKRGCFSRPLGAFIDGYRYVGLARPSSNPDCLHRVLGAARDGLRRGEFNYAASHCLLLEAAALARRFVPRRVEPRVVQEASRLARKVSSRSAETNVTCASFVLHCFENACQTCRLRTGWPARDRVPAWKPRPTPTDVRPRREAVLCGEADASRVVRVMASPADLWVARGYQFRVVIESESAIVLADLTGHDDLRLPLCRHDAQVLDVSSGATISREEVVS